MNQKCPDVTAVPAADAETVAIETQVNVCLDAIFYVFR